MENEKNYVKEIIETIMEAANLGALPENEKNDFRETLELQINRRIGLISVDCLNEEGVKLYDEIMASGEKPDENKLKEIFDNYAPGYEGKIKDGLEKFIQEIVEVILKK